MQIILSNIFYLPNIAKISCQQVININIINEIFYSLFFVLSLWYLVCILCIQHILVWTNCISSAQYSQVARGCHIG